MSLGASCSDQHRADGQSQGCEVQRTHSVALSTDPSLCLQLGLHVFFGCYHNLFRLMTKCGALDNLLLKDHTHTFVNEGDSLRWWQDHVPGFRVQAGFRHA